MIYTYMFCLFDCFIIYISCWCFGNIVLHSHRVMLIKLIWNWKLRSDMQKREILREREGGYWRREREMWRWERRHAWNRLGKALWLNTAVISVLVSPHRCVCVCVCVAGIMGRIFLDHIGGTRLFSCANCDTILTNRSELISTRFTGATGRAFLFNKACVHTYTRVCVCEASLYSLCVCSMYRVNSSGPTTEPCGTPYWTCDG